MSGFYGSNSGNYFGEVKVEKFNNGKAICKDEVTREMSGKLDQEIM